MDPSDYLMGPSQFGGISGNEIGTRELSSSFPITHDVAIVDINESPHTTMVAADLEGKGQIHSVCSESVEKDVRGELYGCAMPPLVSLIDSRVPSNDIKTVTSESSFSAVAYVSSSVSPGADTSDIQIETLMPSASAPLAAECESSGGSLHTKRIPMLMGHDDKAYQDDVVKRIVADGCADAYHALLHNMKGGSHFSVK